MQRLNEEDLSGHWLKKGGFKHVCIPMRYDPDQGSSPDDPRAKPHPKDPRTRKGELLWPEFFTEERVAKLERDLGPYGTAGQLQQRPAPEGGGLFQRSWFRVVEEVPKTGLGRDGRQFVITPRRVRGWDTASVPGGGDYTMSVLIADAGENIVPRFYIEDVAGGQWGPLDVDRNMQMTAHADGAQVAVREEQEGGSAGKAVTTKRRLDLAGFDYAPVSLSGSKVVRAGPLRSQCEGLNVALVRGPWNEDFLTEFENFPNGAHDDRIDASSCAFNALMEAPPAEECVVIGWGS
jgi:predicted phage terminase large subunit-like protein